MPYQPLQRRFTRLGDYPLNQKLIINNAHNIAL